MSLINEALKRAQRQRGDTVPPLPPAAGAPPPSPVPPTAPVPFARSLSQPRRPRASARGLVLPAAGAGLLLVAGLVIWVFFWPVVPVPPAIPGHPSQPVAQTAPAAPVNPSPAAETKAAPAADLTTVALAPPATTFAPAAPIAPVENQPAPPTPPPVLAVPVAPVLVAPSAPPASVIVNPVAPPIASTPMADPRVNAFLDALHVTAILPSATSPKVIMNGQIYRLNDVVDRPTGLRITKITGNSLAFRDAAGFEYTHEPHP